MLNPPTEFVARLTATFAGDLRVRWSLREQRWLIEQRVGRGALLPRRVSEIDDDMIRARDGYARVMACAPGTTTSCAVCRTDIKLAIRETVDIKCPACKRVSRETAIGGFFPLDDHLIEHLKMMDPTRFDQLARVRAETARQEWLNESRREAEHREGAAQYKDALLDQFPKAGFPSLTPDGWAH